MYCQNQGFDNTPFDPEEEYFRTRPWSYFIVMKGLRCSWREE